jgi:hypothetical protein
MHSRYRDVAGMVGKALKLDRQIQTYQSTIVGGQDGTRKEWSQVLRARDRRFIEKRQEQRSTVSTDGELEIVGVQVYKSGPEELALPEPWVGNDLLHLLGSSPDRNAGTSKGRDRTPPADRQILRSLPVERSA